jgi:hypothetical protein
MKVTANSRKGKNTGAGQKVKKRFFLNRVNMDRTRVPIYYSSQDTVDVDSHPAITALAWLNQAFLRT